MFPQQQGWFHSGDSKSETARLVRQSYAGAIPELAPAGVLRAREVARIAAWAAFLFVWVMAMSTQKFRLFYPQTTGFIMWTVVVLVLLWPVMTYFIYLYGIWRTIRESVARFSACNYWLFWPFWRVALCLVAVCVAADLSNGLWYDNFRLYEEYYRLQAYDNVDAATVSGIRLRDAGLVRFNDTIGVDRSKAGCIVNGHTYCVAPIVQLGVVAPGISQSEGGTQDLFMAGIDCCNCPVTDFRCGDWDRTGASIGGMRLLDTERSRMFQLAAEKFAASYAKVIGHSVFFEWKNEPIEAWKQLWARGMQLFWLDVFFGVFGTLLAVLLLNGGMMLMMQYKLAAPLEDMKAWHSSMDQPRDLNQHQYLGWFNDRRHNSEERGFIPPHYSAYLKQADPISSTQGGHYSVIL